MIEAGEGRWLTAIECRALGEAGGTATPHWLRRREGGRGEREGERERGRESENESKKTNGDSMREREREREREKEKEVTKHQIPQYQS